MGLEGQLVQLENGAWARFRLLPPGDGSGFRVAVAVELTREERERIERERERELKPPVN